MGAEELSAAIVADDADGDRFRARAIPSVVFRYGDRGDWGEPGGAGFVLVEAGPRGDEVKGFHDLGADRSGEASATAELVFSGDPALFVRWCRGAGL